MTTWYISPSGNDSTGAGTLVSPWKTIAKADASASNGDTVIVGAGTTTWVSQNPFVHNLTITGAGAGVTIFDGAAGTVGWNIPGTVNISGITFQNAAAPSSGVFFSGASSSCAITLTSCVFNGLTISASSCGVFGETGIISFVPWGSITLVGCLIYNTTTATSTNSIFAIGSEGFSLACKNCTFYSNIGNANTANFIFPGIYGTPPGLNMTLTNNIIWNANGTNKAFLGGTPAPTYLGTNNDILGYSGTPSLSNQISTDPLFVDVASLNFNLRPSSPCLDTGVII